jgi:hypothetical protein
MDESVEISRGQEAKRILENPLLVEALEAVRERCRSLSERSLPSQKDVREGAYYLLAATNELERHLTSFATTGKLAAVAQDQREEQKLRERKLSEWDGSPDGPT